MPGSSEASAPSSTTAQKPILIPAMTLQQEDSIIHTRITNDEKALRRVTKKFHNYTSVAYDAVVPLSAATSGSVDDARDAFLVELASFHLSLKKSLMVCEAEARQVEEYQREKERIEHERVHLKDQIEGLKLSLEQAQIQRRRKMEYDGIAEKINALPTRDELEQSIRALESDMTAIREEHEDQTRVLRSQKAALDVVITNIQDLRLMGKQDVDVPEEEHALTTPAPDAQAGESADGETDDRTREETGEITEENVEGASTNRGTPISHNPGTTPFLQLPSRLGTPLTTHVSTPIPSSDPGEPEEGETDDIEMGELAEDPEDKPQKKKVREEDSELEEGEASDSDLGSALTDISDD